MSRREERLARERLLIPVIVSGLEAYAKLCELYQPDLLAYARKMWPDLEPEDLVQETLRRFHAQFLELRLDLEKHQGAFPWLTTTLKHVALDIARRGSPPGPHGGADDPPPRDRTNLYREAISRALNGRSEPHRLLTFLLMFYLGVTPSEVVEQYSQKTLDDLVFEIRSKAQGVPSEEWMLNELQRFQLRLDLAAPGISPPQRIGDTHLCSYLPDDGAANVQFSEWARETARILRADFAKQRPDTFLRRGAGK